MAAFLLPHLRIREIFFAYVALLFLVLSCNVDDLDTLVDSAAYASNLGMQVRVQLANKTYDFGY